MEHYRKTRYLLQRLNRPCFTCRYARIHLHLSFEGNEVFCYSYNIDLIPVFNCDKFKKRHFWQKRIIPRKYRDLKKVSKKKRKKGCDVRQ
jgi:hypothetical protein